MHGSDIQLDKSELEQLITFTGMLKLKLVGTEE